MKNSPFTKIHFTTKRQKNVKQFDIRTDFKFDWNVKSTNGKKLMKTVKILVSHLINILKQFKINPYFLVVEIC